MKTILIIGLGGGLGSVLRYWIQTGAGRWLSTSFPAGTFIVNILGCLAIGIIYGLAEKHTWPGPEWRMFLVTGLCGGFTTFSSFSYESIALFKQGHYLYFLLYLSLSVVLGLLATVGGMVLMAPAKA